MRFLSLVLRTAGLATAVACVLALCPERAEASCGHYVTVANGHGSGDADHGSPELPCDGPNCSQQPTIPFVPAPAPAAPIPDAKAMASGVIGNSDIDEGPVLAGTSRVEAVHRPGSVFHPPRD